MALGRRCDIGCQTWPDKVVYAKCPVCGGDTTRFSKMEPLSDAEAAELAFEAYYERRGPRDDGPLSERARRLLER